MLRETKETHKDLADALAKHCISEESNAQVSVGQELEDPKDPKPRDADEQALYHQYKVDLWKMRSEKAKGVFIKPIKAEVKPIKAEIMVPIKKEPEIPDKAVHMVSSSSPETAMIVVPTSPKDPETPFKAAETVVPTPMETQFSDLDEYSQAAVKSMDKVEAKKKAAAKSKGGTTGIKEVKKHMKGGRTASAKAASATKKKKNTYPKTAEVLPKGKMPKDTLDGTNPPAVNYLQGVIYTCQTQKKFRGLRVRGNPYTEKSASWINQTKAAAWKQVTAPLEKI